MVPPLIINPFFIHISFKISSISFVLFAVSPLKIADPATITLAPAQWLLPHYVYRFHHQPEYPHITLLYRSSLSIHGFYPMYSGINAWPPNPGCTDMIRIMSTFFSRFFTEITGVSGQMETPTLHPHALIFSIVALMSSQASRCTVIKSAPAFDNASHSESVLSP